MVAVIQAHLRVTGLLSSLHSTHYCLPLIDCLSVSLSSTPTFIVTLIPLTTNALSDIIIINNSRGFADGADWPFDERSVKEGGVH
jgi:hypothetical protein